jgi:UDPglucose 6-dehydrogenase
MSRDLKLKIGIIGLGMVGQPIKKWFEEYQGLRRGKELFCYDIDSKKGYSDDVNKADLIFISVPTPTNPDGSCNISIVESAVAGLKDGKIVIVKSTVPPGTVEAIQKKNPKKRLIFNPEFLTESQAWEDFISPDRQIIGPTSKSVSDSIEVLNLLPRKNFIRPWTSDYAKKSVNATEAEFGKYASNVFGFIKVVYGNILADLCYATAKARGIKVDYDNVKELITADLRIGPAWLNVNHGNYSGAGGYCFPKDMNAFISFAEDLEKAAVKKKLGGKEYLKVLREGIEVLKSIRKYNKVLIESQGLTMEDVSRHNKDLILSKRKKIRS